MSNNSSKKRFCLFFILRTIIVEDLMVLYMLAMLSLAFNTRRAILSANIASYWYVEGKENV